MQEVNANLVNITRNIEWCTSRGKIARGCANDADMEEVRWAALVVIRYLCPDHPILG